VSNNENHDKLKESLNIFLILIGIGLIYAGWVLSKRQFALNYKNTIAVYGSLLSFITVLPTIVDMAILLEVNKGRYHKHGKSRKKHASRYRKTTIANTDRYKKFQKKVILVMLLFTVVPFCIAFFPRRTLSANGTIARFGIFNNEHILASASDYESVDLRIAHYKTRAFMDGYYIVLNISANGHEYSFYEGNFENFGRIVQFVNTLGNSNVTYSGGDRLDLYIEDSRITVEECEWLRERFWATDDVATRQGDGHDS